MLKAWNTGHPGGITTVHANSAPAGLLRLEQLVQEAVVIDDDRRIDPDRSRHRGGRPDHEIGKTSSVVESNQALAGDDDQGGNADLGFGPCDCPGSSTLSLRSVLFRAFPLSDTNEIMMLVAATLHTTSGAEVVFWIASDMWVLPASDRCLW